MQNKAMSNFLVLAAVIVALVSVTALVPAADADDVQYDEDLGKFWSYTIGFSYRGEGALSVTWDFGDDTEPVTAWSVVHGYPVSHDYTNPGVYYVTQTASNDNGDSVAVYKVTVMGYPYVEFDSRGGSEVERIMMTSGGINATTAEKPADPVWEGHTFSGWYTDEECTQPYDWAQKVTEPVTLYAGWDITEVPGGDGGETQPEDGGDSTEWLAIALIIIGAIITAIALFTIKPAALIGIIVIVVGVIKFAGVF